MSLIKVYIRFFSSYILCSRSNRGTAELQQQHALLPYVLRKKDGLFDYLLGFKCRYHDLGQEEFQALEDISIRTIKHPKSHLLGEKTKNLHSARRLW